MALSLGGSRQPFSARNPQVCPDAVLLAGYRAPRRPPLHLSRPEPPSGDTDERGVGRCEQMHSQMPAPVPFRAPAASTRLPQVTKGGGDSFAPCFAITGSGIKVASAGGEGPAQVGRGDVGDRAVKRASSAEHAGHADAHDPASAPGARRPSHQPARALPGGGGGRAAMPPGRRQDSRAVPPILAKAANDSAAARQLRSLEAAAASAAAAAACDWRALVSRGGVAAGSRGSGGSMGISRSGSAGSAAGFALGDVMAGGLRGVKRADDVGWGGGEMPFFLESGSTPHVHEHERGVESSSSAPPSGASRTRHLLAKQPRAAAEGSGRGRVREILHINKVGAQGPLHPPQPPSGVDGDAERVGWAVGGASSSSGIGGGGGGGGGRPLYATPLADDAGSWGEGGEGGVAPLLPSGPSTSSPPQGAYGSEAHAAHGGAPDAARRNPLALMDDWHAGRGWPGAGGGGGILGRGLALDGCCPFGAKVPGERVAAASTRTVPGGGPGVAAWAMAGRSGGAAKDVRDASWGAAAGGEGQQQQQLLQKRYDKEKERERERERQRELARRAAAQRLLDDPVPPTNALAKRGQFVPPTAEQRLRALKSIREHFRGSEEETRELKAMLNTARARRGLGADAKIAVVTGGNKAVKAS